MKNLKLDDIDTAIRSLREQKKVLLEQKKIRDALSSRRDMLPMSGEIDPDTRKIFAVTPSGYHIVTNITVDSLHNSFAGESWTKILNSLQRTLDCDSTDICVMYRSSGMRAGSRYPLFAFKHRFNIGMNEGMQYMREAGLTPHFARISRTWIIEDNDISVAILHDNLSRWFRYLIDVRSATVYRAIRESPYFRPNFTRNDNLENHRILNSLCTYIWKEMPDSMQELKEHWLDLYFVEPESGRDIAMKLMGLGMEISSYLHRGKVPGETGSAREWIRERFENIVDDRILQHG